MATVSASAARSVDRVHIVLVPGFAGFDALGQIEYYAGTTDRFARWFGSGGAGGQTAVLHYFDNLPTAGVATRAERLRTYLATRIARREIQDGDRVALIGHSTGGLDIRRLLFPAGETPERWVDGGDRTERAPSTAIRIDRERSWTRSAAWCSCRCRSTARTSPTGCAPTPRFDVCSSRS